MPHPSKPLLSVTLLRKAYENGLFPMAESDEEEAEIHWYRPEPRAILVPDFMHISKKMARLIRKKPFDLRWNDDFRAVMQACGQNRDETWINPVLVNLYTQWHEAGEAFCLSVFRQEERVGGIYGVQIGGVFMAESMFSTVSNASSVALIVLVAGLRKAGIELIDVQFRNPHSDQFGTQEIADADYMEALNRLKDKKVELKEDYFCFDLAVEFTQSLSHTS